MDKVKINQYVSFSKVIQGFWRAQDWQWTPQQLNRYFYFQGINTAAAYLVVWTQISLRKRLKEIRLIMEDPRFIRFLEKQKQYGDIHKLDYILLKQKNYVVYYLVHFVYTYLKKWMHKEF